jgi:hypothetical protein
MGLLSISHHRSASEISAGSKGRGFQSRTSHETRQVGVLFQAQSKIKEIGIIHIEQ